MVVVGVDIGNDSTEACIGRLDANAIEFLSSSCTETTGIKGTCQNVNGIKKALELALKECNLNIENIDVICINEATPVIADLAMSTVTETIITESAMIGHNPLTPGGFGLGIGTTIEITNIITKGEIGKKYIPVVPKSVDFESTAKIINQAFEMGIQIEGAIIQRDEAVLVNNRLIRKIPIVDEVQHVEMVPLDMLAAVEVAGEGQVIRTLCNPYGLATIFKLNAEKTAMVAPMAVSLIGNRSAVVIKTPEGSIKERRIPAGKIKIFGDTSSVEIDVNEGADSIMQMLGHFEEIADVVGEPGTNVGGMLWRVKQTMQEVSGQPFKLIKIKDILAVDTSIPEKIKGGLAGEYTLNKAVALGAMVWTNKSLITEVAQKLTEETGKKVFIEGIEVVMAQMGARTTPGVQLPMALIDIGAGSTDVAWIDSLGECKKYVHLAGAGDMVTMMINSELQLNDLDLAEKVKKFPAAKVESMYHVRLEDGTIKFFSEPLPPSIFGKVVIFDQKHMEPIESVSSLEKVKLVRQTAKKRVFITNVIRGLTIVAPGQNLHTVRSAVLVGGSSLDFETPLMISETLLRRFGIVCGSANVRGKEGPRNAVATGLVLSYFSRRTDGNVKKQEV